MKSGPTLKPATRRPRSVKAAIRPVATVVVPTPDRVPATTTLAVIGSPSAWRSPPDSLLAADALVEGMLELAHLGDEVGDLDQRRGGVATGDDDVLEAGAVAQHVDHFGGARGPSPGTIHGTAAPPPHWARWVVNAYALGYGGFLLLGGRLADRLGRRRVFLAGVAVFTLASLVGGLAPSAGVLVAARGLQGLGAALAGPASLSIITTAFAEGPERNRALGVWSAVLASGGAIGMLAGGLLTQYASWRWVLFVNVPVGALLLAATPRVVPAAPGEPRARIDAAGAVTVTAGLAGLVYATTQVPEHGWATPGTVGFLLVAAVLSPRTGEGGGAWSAASSSCCLSSSACSRAERIVVARRSTIISSSTPRISAAGR